MAVAPPAGLTFTAIAAGTTHSVAVASDGSVWAWGMGASGQLGDGTTADATTPTAVSMPAGTPVTQVAAGGAHTLALTTGGLVFGWGSDVFGQLATPLVQLPARRQRRPRPAERPAARRPPTCRSPRGENSSYAADLRRRPVGLGRRLLRPARRRLPGPQRHGPRAHEHPPGGHPGHRAVRRDRTPRRRSWSPGPSRPSPSPPIAARHLRRPARRRRCPRPARASRSRAPRWARAPGPWPACSSWHRAVHGDGHPGRLVRLTTRPPPPRRSRWHPPSSRWSPNRSPAARGQPLPTLTYHLTGFKDGDTVAVVSGQASCTTTAQSGSFRGTYPVTCSPGTLSAANYVFRSGPTAVLTLAGASGGYAVVGKDGSIWTEGSPVAGCASRIDGRHAARRAGGRGGLHAASTTATGWWPPTAASSPSGPPASPGPWAGTRSTARSSAWPPRRTAAATGRSPPTAASSPSVTPASTGRPGPPPLVAPIVGMAATPDGRGYWLVASDGGIFAYGDAPFYGSAGGQMALDPVVGMAPTGDGHGYWMVTRPAPSSPTATPSSRAASATSTCPHRWPASPPPVTAGATGSSGADGGVFAFGDAPYLGGGVRPARTHRRDHLSRELPHVHQPPRADRTDRSPRPAATAARSAPPGPGVRRSCALGVEPQRSVAPGRRRRHRGARRHRRHRRPAATRPERPRRRHPRQAGRARATAPTSAPSWRPTAARTRPRPTSARSWPSSATSTGPSAGRSASSTCTSPGATRCGRRRSQPSPRPVPRRSSTGPARRTPRSSTATRTPSSPRTHRR